MNHRADKSWRDWTPTQWALIAGVVLVALIALAMLRPGGSTDTGLKPGVGPGNPGAASVETNDSEATKGDPKATADPTDIPDDVESDEADSDSDCDSDDSDCDNEDNEDSEDNEDDN